MTEQVKSSSFIDRRLVEQYKETGDHYLANAKALWSKNELRKASEMLWGAVAQYLKALKARKGGKIYGLSEFHEFVKALAKEQTNEYFHSEFVFLRVLHNNFYDSGEVPDTDFPEYYARTIRYLRKINRLLRRPAD
jgi:hypothetical protein